MIIFLIVTNRFIKYDCIIYLTIFLSTFNIFKTNKNYRYFGQIKTPVNNNVQFPIHYWTLRKFGI